MFIGPPHRRNAPLAEGSGPGEEQALTAVVPRVQIVEVTVVATGGTGPVGVGSVSRGARGAGGVASTGLDLEPPVVLATLLLALGAGALAAGRTRGPLPKPRPACNDGEHAPRCR